jgi:hypothetical protein
LNPNAAVFEVLKRKPVCRSKGSVVRLFSREGNHDLLRDGHIPHHSYRLESSSAAASLLFDEIYLNGEASSRNQIATDHESITASHTWISLQIHCSPMTTTLVASRGVHVVRPPTHTFNLLPSVAGVAHATLLQRSTKVKAMTKR